MIEIQRLYMRLISSYDQYLYSMMLALNLLYDDDDDNNPDDDYHDDDDVLMVVSLDEMVDELALERWIASYDDEDSNEHDHRTIR